MIQAVFLDIDDTLLSFSGYVREAMREGFRRFGLKPYTEEMYPVFQRVNDRLWRRIEQGELTVAELRDCRWQSIFAELGIVGDGAAFEDYFRDQLFTSAIPETHAMELLSYLRGRYLLCAASNGPYEQQVNRLRIAGMSDFFSYLFISEKIGAQKPSAAFFDACFAELRTELPKLQPADCVMIGDSLSSDIAGGHAYGMRTILYTKGKELETVPEGVDDWVKDLEEIKKLL